MSVEGVLLTMLTSLLLTEAVELTISFVLGVRRKKGLMLVFLASLMTNPAVVFSYIAVRMTVGMHAAERMIPLLEIAAVIAEAALYALTPGMLRPEELFAGKEKPGSDRPEAGRRNRRWPAALLLSIVLNAASYLAGLLINAF